jgi:very-short-patch-repair endonuclease
MPKHIDEAYVISQYTKHNRSANDISKELGTYPKKIARIISKHGYDVRGRSEAQKAALESGLSAHPTAGKKRSEEEKNSIARGVSRRWQNLPEEKKKEFSMASKERWDSMSDAEKQEIQSAAARALRLAGIEGSKAEKFLRRKLMENDYDVVLHKKGLIAGNHEIDIFLPELKTVIEIDGPQHFLPIWGQDKLNQTIKYDIQKNGQLLTEGYCVLRIKYLCNQMNRAVGQKLWALVKDQVDNIARKFPPKGSRYIEIEVSMENHK